MIWNPEAQRDPHHWLATFGGHLAIGVALWLAFAWAGSVPASVFASLAYAGWEVWSARRWGLLLWDSLLDWCGVTFGAIAALGLWQQAWPLAAWCCASCIVIAIAGSEKRRN